jgi:hypothetical protein
MKNTLVLEKEKTEANENSHSEADTLTVIKVLHLEDGRYVPIWLNGMVDIAVRELGARLVEVERLKVEDTPVTCET